MALLQELIRIDTANPPGNEERAQQLLAETLTEAGFDCELLAAEPGRPNLVARLGGESAGPTLCLLGHADTVPADPSEWSFDPWAGDVVDGEVRGRGAQDMKDQVAAEVAAAAALGRDGWRPRKGELLVVITADEEMGAAAGAQWLCSEHPDKVRSDYVLNEGGGISFEFGRAALLHALRGREGTVPLPDASARRRRPRLGPGPGGQRAPEAGPGARAPARAAAARADARRRGLRRGAERGGDRPARSRGARSRGRAAARGGPRGRRLPGRADAEGDPGANRGQRLHEGERDPLARRGPGRLPRATGDGPLRGARARPGGAG